MVKLCVKYHLNKLYYYIIKKKLNVVKNDTTFDLE